MAKPYFDMAAKCGYSVFVVECQNDFGNTHGVPETTIQKMRDEWEPLARPRPTLWHITLVRLHETWNRIKTHFRR
jgi:hypothetical protein